MKQNLVFQINKTKDLDFSFLSEKQMMQFPVHEHNLTEVQQSLVVYTYSPSSNFDKLKWIKLLTKKLKVKYNAESVIFLGSKVNDISITS